MFFQKFQIEKIKKKKERKELEFFLELLFAIKLNERWTMLIEEKNQIEERLVSNKKKIKVETYFQNSTEALRGKSN